MAQRGKSVKDLVKRDEKGRFVTGQSGNPAGRPEGSKNRVNLLKISLEEGFREGNFEKIAMILNSVVEDALDGDKMAKKMVWDACISKANLSEDKEAKGDGPQILIKHMTMEKAGDIIDVEAIEENTNE
jgi:hypothetical protein